MLFSRIPVLVIRMDNPSNLLLKTLGNANTPAVELEDLCVGYGRRPILKDLNLKVLRGQFIAIIGPNGAGKSTLLKTLAGLLKPLGGVAYVDGLLVHRLKPSELARKLAVVLTERIHPGLLRSYDIVALGRHPYTSFMGKLSKRDHEVITESLQLVNAEHLADRYFVELSDGEKQKILIARALAQEPKILLLDEPVTFLDLKHKFEILRILRSLARDKGVTVIASLHEISLVPRFCDYVVLVKSGKIMTHGIPEEILTEHAISSLYDLQEVEYSSILNEIELSPLHYDDASVFVVGGAGTGSKVYRLLAKHHISFATGILFKNDIDYFVAKTMKAKVISCDAFQPIDHETYIKAINDIDEVDIVIDTGFHVGSFNRQNLTLIEEAAKLGKQVFTFRRDKPFIGDNVTFCSSINELKEKLFQYFMYLPSR